MHYIRTLGVLLFTLLFTFPALAQSSAGGEALAKQALSMLQAADSGGYVAAYPYLSPLLTAEVTPEQFASQMEAHYLKRSKALSHTLLGQSLVPGPQGQQDGRWQRLFYATESVTADGDAFSQQEFILFYLTDAGDWQIVDWVLSPAEFRESKRRR